jgi:glycosyltransferase involved in cell wall biosynthesis
MPEDLVVVLPSLNPDEKLVQVVENLTAAGFSRIVVVDDGSDGEHKAPFALARERFGCENLAHGWNRGKGRALKTGFEFVLERYPDCAGVVTVDGDGQHRVCDVLSCTEALLACPDALVLGVRDVRHSAAPLRSQFGNWLTAMILRVFHGVRVSDTQTGLRGIPVRALDSLCQVKGERFEYETNVLLAAGSLGIPIHEVKIGAVYIDGNASSHFRAVRDSFIVYRAIFPFALSSAASAFLDVALFAGLNFWLSRGIPAAPRLFAATAGARAVSAVFNFLCNHHAVFRSGQSVRRTFTRYAALCAVQGFASYLFVLFASTLLPGGLASETAYKAVGDAVLFFLSFQIQRTWVFGK